MLLRAATLVLAAGLLPQNGPAQDAPPTAPRIGLVLSGGGARGAAHAGVLAVLEELRVPVHCVVGTSMGAIVGGLYAYGHTPDELQQLLTRRGLPTGWDHLLRDGGGRDGLPFRRKEETRLLTGRIRLDLDGFRLKLPKGWIQGQNLETELRLQTMHAHDLASFDELPLPFRCVAVDIGTGEELVLDRGDLALAMRASMSLPGIFAPARWNGRELLDGGLTNNVPVDVARALGCDTLIVVDIGSPPSDAAAIADLLDVTLQMFAILTQQNVDRSLATLGADDVLIRPDLGDMSSADFTRAEQAIAQGVAATRAVAERLRRHSVDEASYARHLQRQRRPPGPSPTIRSVHVENGSGLADDVVTSVLGVEAGRPLDEDRLQSGLLQLYGNGDLQRVAFAVRDPAADTADLEVRVEPKEWGTDTLHVGLRLESNFKGSSDYELAGLYTKKHLNALGAELRVLAGLGNQSAGYLEWYQPVTRDRTWFIAPNAAAAQTAGDVYSGSTKLAEGDIEYFTGGIDVGAALGSFGELRVGWQRVHGTVEVGLSVLPFPVPEIEFDDGYARALVQVDTLDDGFFPRHGFASAIQLARGDEQLGGDADYTSLAFAHSHARSFDDLTLVLSLAYDTTLSDSRPSYARPSLGGFLAISGLPKGSLSGQHMGLATAMVRHRLTQGLAPLHIGGSLEMGNVWQSRGEQFEEWIFAGSAFVAIDSPIGPLHVGAGFAEGGESTAFLFLGPTR